jgi:hypothetical protein
MIFKPSRVLEVETEWSRRSKVRRRTRFLVIRDFDALASASGLVGKALALYLLILYRRALTRKSSVKLPGTLLTEFGIDRHARARGLVQLEGAGLIRTKRAPNHSVEIELVAPSRQKGSRRGGS